MKPIETSAKEFKAALVERNPFAAMWDFEHVYLEGAKAQKAIDDEEKARLLRGDELLKERFRNYIDYCEMCKYRETVGIDEYRCALTGKMLNWYSPSCEDQNPIEKN